MLYFSPWKTTLILLAVLAGFLYAAPNLLSSDTRKDIPTWLPNRAMTLGLDLQGGSHILLQVDRAQLQAEKLETLQDDIRRILREARIGYRFAKSGDNAVNITLVEAGEIAAAKDKLSELTTPVQGGLFGQGTVTEVEMSEPSDGVIRMTLTDQGIRNALSHALTQSVEVVSRRVNELGTTEPIIQRHGDDRILVQVPGLQDPQRLKDLLGQTAKLTFHLVSTEMSAQEALTSRPPAGTKVLYEEDTDPPTPYLVESRAMVEGENLVAAQVGTDAQTNEPVVSFRFDTKGATRFCQVTSANVGRPFAIVLDEHVISAPVIRDAICGGSGQISGNFNFETANDLAVLLRAGALPADLNIVEERTVGPSLGADSIRAGQIASVFACILVFAFLLSAYGILGLIASVAIAANAAMIVAILSVLGATLTLPGIAGIVLTIGMAVDSNVIIFERVREERRQGRSIVQSLDSGFKQATSTIIDANLTTFIAAAILFWLGSGPVKGFAVTLAIGIVTTVFTAFTFTRWMIALWLRRSRPTEMPRGLVNYIPFDTKIPFMSVRKYAFAFSIITSLATVALFTTMSMNLGVDFRGGSLIEVQAKSGNADIANVRERLEGLNLGEVQVQEFGSPRDLLIRVGSQQGDSADQSGAVLVSQTLESDYELRRVEVVGPTVSAELTRNGIIGVTVAMLAMMIYIWFRFEWQFGVGAIVSTLHDVIMIMGFYILTGIEFNLTSIAAVLTIVGYSINDTVVVYDRMRENLRKYKKMPISELIDMSLNQTLSRTILTGVTTLAALIVLYLFGGEVISSFTIAMIFGIVIGTYSSVFVAGPLLILFKLRPGMSDASEAANDKAVGAGTPSGA